MLKTSITKEQQTYMTDKKYNDHTIFPPKSCLHYFLLFAFTPLKAMSYLSYVTGRAGHIRVPRHGWYSHKSLYSNFFHIYKYIWRDKPSLLAFIQFSQVLNQYLISCGNTNEKNSPKFQGDILITKKVMWAKKILITWSRDLNNIQ